MATPELEVQQRDGKIPQSLADLYAETIFSAGRCAQSKKTNRLYAYVYLFPRLLLQRTHTYLETKDGTEDQPIVSHIITVGGHVFSAAVVYLEICKQFEWQFSPICALSQLAKLANSLWHSQFISVFMCECLFIYFAPNRPICRHHLPTQIVALAIPPCLPPCACLLSLLSTCFHLPCRLKQILLCFSSRKRLYRIKVQVSRSKGGC